MSLKREEKIIEDEKEEKEERKRGTSIKNFNETARKIDMIIKNAKGRENGGKN